jgi:hypothetical protein
MEAINSGRLRFAVSNFKQMQGLRQVAIGAFVLVVFVPVLRQGDLTYIGIVLIPALAGLIYALKRINVYYERRIGHLEQRPPGTARSILTILFTSVIPFGVHPGSLTSAAAYMKGFSPEWWLGCLFLGVVIMTRRRWYYLPFAGLLLALGWWRGSTADIDVMGRIDEWFLVVLPVALVVTGIFDHLYLLHTFRPVTEERNV